MLPDWYHRLCTSGCRRSSQTLNRFVAPAPAHSHGFLTNEATMIGVETRTSAPVRIVRDKDTLQHVRLKGLFPAEREPDMQAAVSAGIDGNGARKP